MGMSFLLSAANLPRMETHGPVRHLTSFEQNLSRQFADAAPKRRRSVRRALLTGAPQPPHSTRMHLPSQEAIYDIPCDGLNVPVFPDEAVDPVARPNDEELSLSLYQRGNHPRPVLTGRIPFFDPKW